MNELRSKISLQRLNIEIEKNKQLFIQSEITNIDVYTRNQSLAVKNLIDFINFYNEKYKESNLKKLI